MSPVTTRRRLLRTMGLAGLGFAGTVRAQRTARKVAANSKVRVLCIGTVGTIGETDRKQVAAHPAAEITGLCDVDTNALAAAAADHPDAFTCRDYREAFDQFGDRFDAVIVATPDHSHAPIMISALAAGKHVYGQKPLVHQLEELALMERTLAARPGLATQLGNQRMAGSGRRAAVEILRQSMLGKAIEAHLWVNSPNDREYFNLDRQLPPPSAPPSHLDWNLWLGPAPEVPYREGIAPVMWRSLWEYGSNGLGDWGCHVLDVLFHAYDELQSPAAVQTHCTRAADPAFHFHPCRSTLTYRVPDTGRFARDCFVIHYSDSGQAVSRAAIGLPPGRFPEANMTVVVCEGGVLALSAGGRLEVWRDGKMTSGLRMPGLPEFPPLNHWHAWIDNCLGGNQPGTPFADAVRMTEAALLAVKATRFPGQELLWDKANLAFTNHEEASQTIVRRSYRDGFAPPVPRA